MDITAPGNPIRTWHPTRALRPLVQAGLIFPLLAAVCEQRCQGSEHLAAGEPAIIVANHTSLLDTLVVLRALPRARRRTTATIAAADYFFTSPLRAALVTASVDAVPLDRRGGNSESALTACAAHLMEGGSLLVFPEGTRSPDGTRGRFHSGAARLALATGVAVIPVGLEGVGDILPKGARMPRPGAAWVHAGPAMRPLPGEDCIRFTARLEASVAALCHHAQTAAYPAAGGWT